MTTLSERVIALTKSYLKVQGISYTRLYRDVQNTPEAIDGRSIRFYQLRSSDPLVRETLRNRHSAFTQKVNEMLRVNGIENPPVAVIVIRANSVTLKFLAHGSQRHPAALPKYSLIIDPKVRTYGALPVYRIHALRDIPEHGVKAGNNGGIVNSYANLSQDGTCWIEHNAMALGNSRVTDNAWLRGRAVVFDEATVQDSAVIQDDAQVFDTATVGGTAIIRDSACVCEDAFVTGDSIIAADTRWGDWEAAGHLVETLDTPGPVAVHEPQHHAFVMDAVRGAARAKI